MNELPSVALTRRFLVQCQHHGSERLAVQLVAIGRNAGMPGLPATATGRRGTLTRCRRQRTTWNTWNRCCPMNCRMDEAGAPAVKAESANDQSSSHGARAVGCHSSSNGAVAANHTECRPHGEQQ